MHFHMSHSTVKEILSGEFGLRKFTRRCLPHSLSDPHKNFRVDTSIELLASLDQYSELQLEGIATGDESWVCDCIESDSMFAGRHEEVIPRLRLRISIKKVMITDFSGSRQSIPRMPSLKGRNTIQNISFRTYFRPYLMRRNIFHVRKPQSNLYAHLQFDVPQWASSCRWIRSLEDSQSSSSTLLARHQSVRLLDGRAFQRKTEGSPSTRSGRNSHGISTTVR
jgi:hypothetical protein